MQNHRHAEYARATAMCVNFALDSVETEVRRELGHATGEAADVLRRVLTQLRKRRLTVTEPHRVGTA